MNKTNFMKIAIFVIAVGLVVFIAFSLYSPSEKSQETKKESVKDAEKSTGKVNTPETFGDLEIEVNKPKQHTYSLKVLQKSGEENEIVSFVQVTKKFDAFYTEVFNPTAEDIVFESIKLVDDLGNEYKPDSNPKAELDLKDFGRDMRVSPSTRRKGNLIFIEIDEAAKKVELIFKLTNGAEKVFEFRR